MRVLITGAGLIGAHTAAALIRAGHEVALFDFRPDPEYVRLITGSAVETYRGDVRAVDAVLGALRAHQAYAVVHTAGLLGAKANDHPYLAFAVNAGGAAAVAEAARRADVARLVHISSLAVYDWPAATRTSTVDESFPTAPRTPYAASKLGGEAAVRCYAASGWLGVVVFRLAGVYGPGRFRGGAFVGDLLQQAVGRAVGGQPVTIPEALSGHEYLHAADVATAIRLALEHELAGIYNVGTGRVHTADELAEALRRAVPGAPVSAAPGRPSHHPGAAGVYRTPTRLPPPLCVDRLHRDLPDWRCRDLTTGLAGLAAAVRADPPAVVKELAR